MDELGTFIKVWTQDSSFCIRLEDLNTLDVGVTMFVASKTDSILPLTGVGGDEIYLKASIVDGWRISTREARLMDIRLEKLQKDEDRGYRAELGLPYED